MPKFRVRRKVDGKNVTMAVSVAPATSARLCAAAVKAFRLDGDPTATYALSLNGKEAVACAGGDVELESLGVVGGDLLWLLDANTVPLIKPTIAPPAGAADVARTTSATASAEQASALLREVIAGEASQLIGGNVLAGAEGGGGGAAPVGGEAAAAAAAAAAGDPDLRRTVQEFANLLASFVGANGAAEGAFGNAEEVGCG